MKPFYTEKQCRNNLDILANWLLCLESLPNKYEHIVTIDLFDTKTTPYVTLWKVEENTFNTNSCVSIIDYTYLANPNLIALKDWMWNDVARFVYGITDTPAMLLLFNNKWVEDLSPKFAGKIIKFYLSNPTDVWRNHNHAIYPNIADTINEWWLNTATLNVVDYKNIGTSGKIYVVMFSDGSIVNLTKVTSNNDWPFFSSKEEISDRQIAAINEYFNIKFPT